MKLHCFQWQHTWDQEGLLIRKVQSPICGCLYPRMHSGKNSAKCFNIFKLPFLSLTCITVLRRCRACQIPLHGLFVDSVKRCTGADSQLSAVWADEESHLVCCHIAELKPIPAVTEHQRGQSPTALIQSATGQAQGDHMQTDMTLTLTSVPDKTEAQACLW